MNTIAPPQENTKPVVPQRVRWGPSDAFPAGIRVWNSDETEQPFILWPDLKPELERRLLPQLFADPRGYIFETKDYHGKQQWLVEICNHKKERYCDVWFGNDADHDWRFDGLIRVGDAIEVPYVWHGYQRYFDGTYRRILALSPVIDEFIRQYKR